MKHFVQSGGRSKIERAPQLLFWQLMEDMEDGIYEGERGSLLRQPLRISLNVDHGNGTAELKLRDQLE